MRINVILNQTLLSNYSRIETKFDWLIAGMSTNFFQGSSIKNSESLTATHLRKSRRERKRKKKRRRPPHPKKS